MIIHIKARSCTRYSRNHSLFLGGERRPAAAPGLRIRIRDDLEPLLDHLRLKVYRRPIDKVHGDLVHYDLGAVFLEDPMRRGCQS